MFCVATFIIFPSSIDPEIEGVTLFETREEAVVYANSKLAEVEAKYGVRWGQEASSHRNIVLYSNKDIEWRGYISYVDTSRIPQLRDAE